MLEGLDILLKGGFVYVICYIINIVGKCIVVAIISRNKDLTDNKAKFLTKMMSKDININLHQ